METMNTQMETEFDPVIRHELGPENFAHISQICEVIREFSRKQQIEAHLLLVGGNVKPEKRGQPHKDVDLVLYSPQLATEVYMGGDCPKFDAFSHFITTACQQLNWDIEVEKPWFFDYEYCGDGKVIIHPDALPIEILPVRQDKLMTSLKEYLQINPDPAVVLM